MPTAVIDRPEARVRLRSRRLAVFVRDEPAGPERLHSTVRLDDVERLALTERVQISSQAVAALLRAGAPVAWFGANGRYLGATVPAASPAGAARLRHYEAARDPARALAFACAFVRAKLVNQRRLLQRLAAHRGESLLVDLLAHDALLEQAGRAQHLAQLRGYEGAATALHYLLWARFLPPDFPFERRSSRPPRNAVNAVLSFASVLVYHEFVAALHAHGLDPALGFLHVPEDDRCSLALDQMEPFRPALVDALAMHLFNHRILQAKHFDRAGGAVLLNPAGRREFFHHYESRLDREFFSEHAGHRTTMRRQFTSDALALKTAILDPAALFRPFAMN